MWVFSVTESHGNVGFVCFYHVCFTEALWGLKINDHQVQGGMAPTSPYPDRPGEPDCVYYLRTGLCGYGINCRFNHPTYAAQVFQKMVWF